MTDEFQVHAVTQVLRNEAPEDQDEAWQSTADRLDWQEGYEDGYQEMIATDYRGLGKINRKRWSSRQVALLERSRKQYRAGWKAGRSKYLTGLTENASEMRLPIIQPDGKYHVQVGRGSGAYKERYTLESQIEARRYYACLNIFNGYKKRLIGPDGVLEDSYIS